MKIFLVFLGLMLLGASAVAVQSDFGRYMQAQTWMKALAEDCAAGAALYYKEADFADGNWVFDKKEGDTYIRRSLKWASEHAPLDLAGSIVCQAEYFDESNGCRDAVRGHTYSYPSVVVTLTADTAEFFRLPVFSVTRISRSAMYELPHD